MFPRYGAHPGASPTVCFAAPPLDVCGFAAWRCAPTPRMDTYARPAEGAEDQKPGQEPKPKPKPKQIKRSQPSAVSTGDWMYSVKNLVGCQAAIAGKPAPTTLLVHTPCGEAAPLNTMSVSSSTALDLRARRQAEWRGLSGGGSAATVWRSQTQREEVQRSKP